MVRSSEAVLITSDDKLRPLIADGSVDPVDPVNPVDAVDSVAIAGAVDVTGDIDAPGAGDTAATSDGVDPSTAAVDVAGAGFTPAETRAC